MATKKDSVGISLPEMKMGEFKVKLIGDSPLICHAWSKKAKLEMLNKHLKKASTGKEVRRPYVEFADSLYWLTEKPALDGLTDEQARDLLAEVIPHSQFGFPTLAFKSAALDAGFQQGLLVKNAGTASLAKTTAKGATHILGEFAVIDGIPTIREDMVRIGSGTAQTCFRAEFKSWSTELTVRFYTASISAEQIIQLLNLGGFACGVGDWRPAKDGSFGTFHAEV